MSYLILYLILLILIPNAAIADSDTEIAMKVFCQGPVEPTGEVYGYMITSFTRDMSHINQVCKSNQNPSPQLHQIIYGCDFRECSSVMSHPYYVYVEDLPWKSQISIALDLETTTYYGNYTQPQNLYDCITQYPDNHIYCLSITQKASIYCLDKNMDVELEKQKCTPEWFLITITVIAGSFLLILILWFATWYFQIKWCSCCRRYRDDDINLDFNFDLSDDSEQSE